MREVFVYYLINFERNIFIYLFKSNDSYLDEKIQNKLNRFEENHLEKGYYLLHSKHNQNNNKHYQNDNYENHSLINLNPKCSTYDKIVTTKAWFSESFPMTVHEFLPLLSVLSYASKHMNSLREFFSKLIIDDKMFPVKAEIPLKLSLKAVVTIHDFIDSWKK